MPDATTYKAVQNSDGTYNVLDVPIMGEVPKGAKGNDSAVDRAWLDAALAKCKTRESEGYLPPLHLRHHDWGERAEAAGQWRATEVREIDYDGGKMAAIFADLVNVKPDVMSAIQRGDWPYRSVEIHSYGDHEIGSLALLDSEAPFFKFPILRVSEPLADSEAPMPEGPSVQMTTPFRGSASHAGSLALALFRFAPTPAAKMADEPPGNEPVSKQSDDPDPTETQPDDDGEDEDEDEDEDTGEKAPAWAAELSSKVDQILALIAPPKPVGADPAAQAPVVAPAAPDQKATMSASDAGELAARRAADAERVRREEIDAICGRAVAKLRGYELAQETLADIRRLAEKGEDAVAAFCSTYERIAPKDPPRRLEDVAGAGSIVTDPPEVAAYAAKGPTALERARAAVPKYQALVASGFRRSLAEFLTTEVRV